MNDQHARLSQTLAEQGITDGARRRPCTAGPWRSPAAPARQEWVASWRWSLTWWSGVAVEQPDRRSGTPVDRSEARHIQIHRGQRTCIHRNRPIASASNWYLDHQPSGHQRSLAWRKVRLWTVTGRLPCLDVVHLDDMPPVGVIRVQQPSGLPVRTMALDPLSEETQDTNLDTRLRGPDVLDVMQLSLIHN
jgi:hypothetical protein